MAKKTAKKKAPAKKAAPAKKKAATAKKAAPAKKKAEPKKKKAAAKKKSRARAVKEIRLKAYWGVFSQSLKRVALFEFNEKKQAEKKAQDLSKKAPHFVQPVKEVIEE